MTNNSSTSLVKLAIVTGGGGGLGRAFCLRLAERGFHVAIAEIDQQLADETLAAVTAAGGSGQVELLDVSDPAAWETLRDRLQSDWPRLDLLVNNAGLFATGNIGQLDLKVVDRLVRTNLLGTLHGSNAMVPWLVSSAADATPPMPHVINIGSIFAFVSPPGASVYNLTKSGVVGFSETLFGELRPQGVGVTVVCPGPIPTGLFDRAVYEDERDRRVVDHVVAKSRLTTDAVAASSLRAMDRGRLYVVMDRRSRWYWRIKRMLPTTLLKLISRRANAERVAAERAFQDTT